MKIREFILVIFFWFFLKNDKLRLKFWNFTEFRLNINKDKWCYLTTTLLAWYLVAWWASKTLFMKYSSFWYHLFSFVNCFTASFTFRSPAELQGHSLNRKKVTSGSVSDVFAQYGLISFVQKYTKRLLWGPFLLDLNSIKRPKGK